MFKHFITRAQSYEKDLTNSHEILLIKRKHKQKTNDK